MFGDMVGIDIGISQVKLVHVAGGKLKKAVTAQLPDNMVADGVIRSMDAMADFLRATAKENGIPRGNAAIVLPESLVFSRNVTIPAMTASQLNFNLPYEFKDYLTLEKEKYFYDYAVLDTHVDENGTQMELFACAVLKNTIAEYRAMLRRAGFKLKIALPEQWAYVSALRYGKVQGIVCLADLGYEGSRIHVFNNCQPETRRILEQGIGQVDEAIANTHNVDIHMARSYRETDFSSCMYSAQSQSIYERLSVEILKTVNFYNYNHREQALNELCLIGGGAAVEPLRESIRRVTELQVKTLQELVPELAGMETYLKAFGCAVNR